MDVPSPEQGLVICYGFLWLTEADEGREEGQKNRPCAIVLKDETTVEGRNIVYVLPVTHSPPDADTDTIEIPLAVAQHLGLDDDRQWIVLSQINAFFWPGPDLAPVSRSAFDPRPVTCVYGFLPPKFFDDVIKAFQASTEKRRVIKRSE